ncbi:class I SAM-dependent methyltransferase [Dyadobacter sp. CY323]|uniref:class I SAM-dependent methyltransferase n=1 Tax=Dyadobacter sp. CY323 TaxID=2907302 RepID=UPI001F468FED|nr:class I SAM-dependent methyltransferase [Dyadobacter sp. CY323]MCE6991562.1 class I SAM-dependent methyltransferase [Dyadobacter sp. CY323]
MEETSLSEAEIAFIRNHRHEQASQLILKANQFKGLDIKKLAGQILSRQKAAKKLPDWYANEKLIFPPALSVEQCSSEATALYKASLVSGQTLIDITGGMGVDCFYMSQKFNKAHYFEMQEVVAETAHYNFRQLAADNIQVHALDSLVALQENSIVADWIYADPARRNEQREKVVLLSDCTPDVVSNQKLLFAHAPHILLKTSPLLDIDLASRELENLKEVHVIGYEQECKELLFVLDRDHQSEDFTIHVRILDEKGSAFKSLDFNRETERNAIATYSDPAHYLYEPHAAVLKAGAFKTICKRYNMNKLAVNSQLYTSENLAEHFPGRSFKIVAVCKPDMKEISKYIGGDKANLTTRNFPAKTEDLRKKWKLREGGDYYLFATTLADNSKVVIVTVKPAI